MVESALTKKLKLKPGQQAAVINAPSGYAGQLGVEVSTGLAGKPGHSVDFLQIFVKTGQEVEKMVPDVIRVLKHDGFLWISYPKGSAKVKNDINRDTLWKAMEKHGLAGVFMVSIDETWSAMRFRPLDKVGK